MHDEGERLDRQPCLNADEKRIHPHSQGDEPRDDHQRRSPEEPFLVAEAEPVHVPEYARREALNQRRRPSAEASSPAHHREITTGSRHDQRCRSSVGTASPRPADAPVTAIMLSLPPERTYDC